VLKVYFERERDGVLKKQSKRFLIHPSILIHLKVAKQDIDYDSLYLVGDILSQSSLFFIISKLVFCELCE